MPNWNKIKNNISEMADKFSPNRAKFTSTINDYIFNRSPAAIKKHVGALIEGGKRLGQKTVDIGKDVVNDTFEAGISNFRPTNIRDAWLHGPMAAINELKNTTFNPKAWKENTIGTLGTTILNTAAPAFSLGMLLNNDPSNDLEGTVEHYTKKFLEATDVVDPFNKFFFRNGQGGPIEGLGGLLGGWLLNPRYTILPKVTGKIDEWLGTGVSQQELQRRFMNRLERDAAALMKKTKGLSLEAAYDRAAQDILAYNPTYYNKLVGK